MRKFLAVLLTLALLLPLTSCAQKTVKQVSILTPYISSVTTNQMAEDMKKGMEAKGWQVTIVDTKGDVAQLASRMEDTISAKVDAMVIVSTDPSLVKTQIESAAKANIPVFGCDSGFIDGMTANATSDNYAMGEQLTKFLFDQIGDKGNIIALTYRPHPGVAKRCKALDDLLPQYKDIKLITEQTVEVPNPIDNARKIVENLLLANPDKGSITAIWCAWDEPAIGAAQAIKAAGRDEIVVAGVDGNSQAVQMIKDGSPIKGTIAQNFENMAQIVVDQMEKVFKGENIEKKDYYAPGQLVTK